jgi:hypothetical protein
MGKPFWIMSGITVAGLFFGFYSDWAWQLMLLMVGVVVGVAILSSLTHRLGGAQGKEVVLDEESQEVLFPEGGIVSGSLPMRQLWLKVAPGGSSRSGPLDKDWWVIIEGPISEEAGERRVFQMKLYGPGFKGDMELAHAQIRRLGEWREDGL